MWFPNWKPVTKTSAQKVPNLEPVLKEHHGPSMPQQGWPSQNGSHETQNGSPREWHELRKGSEGSKKGSSFWEIATPKKKASPKLKLCSFFCLGRCKWLSCQGSKMFKHCAFCFWGLNGFNYIEADSHAIVRHFQWGCSKISSKETNRFNIVRLWYDWILAILLHSNSIDI